MKTQTLIARITCPKTMATRFGSVCATRLLPRLLLLALPAVVQAQLTYTNNYGIWTYTTTNRTITITGYTGSGGDVIIPGRIPDTANGLPVTSIGDYAFDPNGSLTTVTIPGSVTSIGAHAFQNCTSLTNVVIPNSVTSIGDGAFVYCQLTSIMIPGTVTSIGIGAFYYCTSLSAIMVDPLNPAYSSLDGVLFDKSQTTLIQCPGGKAENFTIPGSVTSIEDNAFYACVSLTSVTIPYSVTNMGSAAFYDCVSLTNVTIPNSVISIAAETFAYSALSSATIGTNVTSIGDDAFLACPLTSIMIPGSVTSIGIGAFSGCRNLSIVYFQGNAPTFGSDVFDYVFTGTPPWPHIIWDPATLYILPGTTGWFEISFPVTLNGQILPFSMPIVLWTPQVKTTDASFGVRTNQFGFNINWASGMTVVVEATTDLANPTWSSLATNTLASVSAYFSDPQWANYPGRFYRLRWP